MSKQAYPKLFFLAQIQMRIHGSVRKVREKLEEPRNQLSRQLLRLYTPFRRSNNPPVVLNILQIQARPQSAKIQNPRNPKQNPNKIENCRPGICPWPRWAAPRTRIASLCPWHLLMRQPFRILLKKGGKGIEKEGRKEYENLRVFGGVLRGYEIERTGLVGLGQGEERLRSFAWVLRDKLKDCGERKGGE